MLLGKELPSATKFRKELLPIAPIKDEYLSFEKEQLFPISGNRSLLNTPKINLK